MIAIRPAVLGAYAAPAVPLAMFGLPLYVYVPAWYGEHLGLALAGTLLLLARVSDVVTDPLVGALGDRIGLRMGARRALMLAGTPLLLVSALALFRPSLPVGAADLFVWSVLAYLGWTLVQLPYAAWGAELSADYHERSRITSTREAGVILGTLLALVLPTALGVGGTPGAALDLLAGLLTWLLPVCVLLAVWLVPDVPRRPNPVSWRSGLRLLAGNRPFLLLFSAYLLNGIANALPATLFLLYVGNVLQAPHLAGALLVGYFTAGVLALPLWLRLARRHDKHRVWAASMLLACAVFVCVPLLGPGDVWGFLAICLLSGLSLGVDVALPASMQADVVDLDEASTGVRRAGLFFGLWGVATKLALALAVGIAFPLLDLAGFEAGGEHGQWALVALYALAPVLIKLCAVALVWRFPLARERHGMLRSRLAAQMS